MYTVIQVGAGQFKVTEGDVVTVGRLDDEKGKTVTLDKILLFSNGTDVRVGQPFLKNVKVTAEVINHSLSDKKIAFKFRRRKNSSTKRGFRSQLTTLSIKKITAN